MLPAVDFPDSNEYRTGSRNEPIGFFLEALPCSQKFDLLLGYFSSAAISILSIGFAQFLYQGGVVRMILNHILSNQDQKIIDQGINSSPSEYDFSIQDYQKVKATLDEYGQHFFECLAWLIAEKKIQLKLIKPKGTKGIAHYKSGVFSDANGNKVKFKSSCNFTAFGLTENLEELSIKRSWTTKSEAAAVKEQDFYFQEIWTEEADFVEYLEVKDLQDLLERDFGGKSIDELLIDEKKLIDRKKKVLSNYHVKQILERLEEKANRFSSKLVFEPSFPYDTPRPYQDEAYENWKKKGFKGIFAMATGTGKTLTALNAVLGEYKKSGSYRAVVVVPTIELVIQWVDEIKGFNYSNIIKVSSQNPEWRTDLRMVTALAGTDSNYSFFIVTTYRSFTQRRFQRALSKLPENTIFIADEAHNLGAKSVVSLLEEFPLKKRIGLSATPERVYDEEGTKEVARFFEEKEQHTFEFSMEKAMEAGYLCKYRYYPILVELTEPELEQYIAISAKLSKFFGNESDDAKEAMEKLLLQRKQIIHKANNKLSAFDDLVKDLHEKDELDYTLVYAPEGYFKDLFTDLESLGSLNTEENRICDIYASRIREIAPEVTVSLFNAATSDRDFVLNSFSDGKIDILVSMKCLDEGVDVPKTLQAIFCASTGNPRQFIQRRGRILRTSEAKHLAVIYDMVVVPSAHSRVGNYQTEKRLIENELKRVYEFADLAINQMEALDRIRPVLDLYDIYEKI